MLAKSPSERYASLDEVIDELADYSAGAELTLWLAEFSPRGLTTAPENALKETARVYSIDLGMHYSATAESTPDGHVKSMLAGENGSPFFRMAAHPSARVIRNFCTARTQWTGVRRHRVTYSTACRFTSVKRLSSGN